MRSVTNDETARVKRIHDGNRRGPYANPLTPIFVSHTGLMSSPPLSVAASKSDAPMGSLGPVLRARLLSFIWPEGRPEDAPSPWVSPFAQLLLWWTLVVFAVLDVIYPLLALNESWWCVFFVLWIVPWRTPVVATAMSRVRIAVWVSTLMLFGWLIYRTQTAIIESIRTWTIFGSLRWWMLLSFPMQSVLAALVTAALVVPPLRRIVGERATAFAIIASLPYALTYLPIRFSCPLAWAAHTMTAGAINVGCGALSLLVVAESSSVLTRFPLRADGIPGYRRLRSLAIGVLNGKLNALLAVSALYGASLAAFVLLTRKWRAQDLATPAALAIYSVIAPAFIFIVLLSALAAWRSLERAGRRHVIINNLATLARIFVLPSAALVALGGFLYMMPHAGNELSQALKVLPGPTWSISHATTQGSLRLSGEFQYGVSDALARALATDPTIHRLELDSPGGDCGEGLALAALVKKHSLSTFVNHQCVSACTMVFVAGRERVLTTGAKLGFHRARGYTWDTILYEDDGSNDQYKRFLISKGIQENFARKAYSVPNNEVWYPSIEELLTAGVISSKPT